MKVEQKEVFYPITITLETKEEARTLYNLVEGYYGEYDKGSPERALLINLSNKLNELNF